MVARGCTDIHFGFCVSTESLLTLMKPGDTSNCEIVNTLSQGERLPDYIQIHGYVDEPISCAKIMVSFGDAAVTFSSDCIWEGEYRTAPFDSRIFSEVETEFHEDAQDWKGKLTTLGLDVSDVGWYKVEYTL